MGTVLNRRFGPHRQHLDLLLGNLATGLGLKRLNSARALIDTIGLLASTRHLLVDLF
jgi:hypothetical protein